MILSCGLFADNIVDKENHSSQNTVDSVSGFCQNVASSGAMISAASLHPASAAAATDSRTAEDVGGGCGGGGKCDSVVEDAKARRNIEETLMVGKSSAAVTSGIGSKGDEEVVMLRGRSGRSLCQQQQQRGNRNGVVYSPNSSKILKCESNNLITCSPNVTTVSVLTTVSL